MAFRETNRGLTSCPARQTVGTGSCGGRDHAIMVQPQCKASKIFMKTVRQLFPLVLLLAFSSAGFAADAVYPPGLRIGLVPMQGLAVSKTFPGFENQDHTVKVLVAELPAAAYGEVQNAFKTNSFPGGANAIRPESLQTAAGEGYYTAETAKD